MFHYRNIMLKSTDGALSGAPTAGAVAKTPKVRGRGLKRSLRAVVLVLVLATAGLAGWWFYLRPQPAAVPQTIAVTRADVQQTVLASGILQASSLVSVGAEVSGRIEKLDVKLGDVVKAGDLLAQIDSLNQENAVKSAEAALASVTAQLHSQQAAVKQAQAALDRSDQLAAKNLISTADHETAQAAVETARAQVDVLNAQIQQANLNVDAAKLNLSRTKITAPSDGTVVAVLVDEGQTVNAAQTAPTIVKLAQLNNMVIKQRFPRLMCLA